MRIFFYIISIISPLLKRKYLLTEIWNNSEKYFKNYKSLCIMECACCGAEMLPDRELEKTIIYKCEQCGLSDTRLKDTK
jgi:hypothetical protein